MNNEEFDKIRAAIKSAWPGKQIMQSKFEINLWFRALCDLDYQICQMALLELITQSVFPPSIAEIRAKYAEYTHPPVKTSGEAWEDVRMAVRKYGFYQPEEALNSLDPLTRQAVQSIGFQTICMSESGVERAHFLKIYETLAKRKVIDAQIPDSLRRFKALSQAKAMRLTGETNESSSGKEDRGDGEGIPGSVPEALLQQAEMAGMG